MKKYLALRFKMTARLILPAIIVVCILFGCMNIIHTSYTERAKKDDLNTKVTLGIVGTANDEYLQWGLAALAFDSASFTVTVKQMNQKEAEASLMRGEISAFAVFPDGFVEQATKGNVLPIKFVSSVGATGFISIFKDSMTQMVNDILVESQKGTYGIGAALVGSGHSNISNLHINKISVEYLDFVFDRSKIYRVENLRINDDLEFSNTIVCGLTVLFFMLSVIPFASLFIRQDRSFFSLLASKRIGALPQVICEFICLALAAVVVAVTAFLLTASLLPEGSAPAVLLLFILSAVTLSAFCYLLFELSNNLVGGVLLTFFMSIVLAFAGGCIYPASFFPDSLKAFADLVFTGVARKTFTLSLLGNNVLGEVLSLLCYLFVFLALSVAVRRFKLTSPKEVTRLK